MAFGRKTPCLELPVHVGKGAIVERRRIGDEQPTIRCHDPGQFANDRLDICDVVKQPSGSNQVGHATSERQMSGIGTHTVDTSTDAGPIEVDADTERRLETHRQFRDQIPLTTANIDHATAAMGRKTLAHQIDKIHDASMHATCGCVRTRSCRRARSRRMGDRAAYRLFWAAAGW